jgi:GDPmannose 4,6-dehydratase
MSTSLYGEAGEVKKKEFGNLSAQRDWGHAKDYIRAMYLMLQQDEPDDYGLAKIAGIKLCESYNRHYEFLIS